MRVARAGGEPELRRDLETGVGVGGVAGRFQLIVDRPQEGRVAKQRPDQVVGIGLLVGVDVFLEIVEAGDSGQPPGGQRQLQFLAELLLVDADENVADFLFGGVDVDIVVGLQLTECGNRLERQRFSQVDRGSPGQAPMRHLGRVGQARRRPALEVVVVRIGVGGQRQ